MFITCTPPIRSTLQQHRLCASVMCDVYIRLHADILTNTHTHTHTRMRSEQKCQLTICKDSSSSSSLYLLRNIVKYKLLDKIKRAGWTRQPDTALYQPIAALNTLEEIIKVRPNMGESLFKKAREIKCMVTDGESGPRSAPCDPTTKSF